MRRLLFLIAVAALLARPAARATAEPTAEPFVLVLRVERAPAEIRIAAPALRRLWPTFSGAWTTQFYPRSFMSKPFVPVVDMDGEVATFVVREPGVVLLFRSAPPGPPEFHSLPSNGVVPRRDGLERFVWTGSSTFGSVASADPAVYDRPSVPHWYAAKLEPGKSVTSTLERPLPPLRTDGPMPRLRLRVVGTHTGPVSIDASWGQKHLGTITRDSAAGGVTFEWSVPTTTWATLGKDPQITFADRTVGITRPEDPNDTSDDVGALWLSSVEIDAATAERSGRFVEVELGIVQELAQIGDEALVAWNRIGPPDVGPFDEIVVATEPMLGPAARLAAHRSEHGVSAVVVRTTDLAPPGDAWGMASAIQRLVATPRTRGSGPRYLLLVGDADRDLGTKDTIPTHYARTLYNGATATDRPYGVSKDGPGAIVGRLPFSDPKALDAYVDRVIRMETKPPADDTRRTLRFITSEGRFGPAIDNAIENLFKQVMKTLPTAYDIEVTFARAQSDFGWPAAEFNRKVIDDLNAGSLFFTYVGHGWWDGFDHLRVEGKRYPILRSEDAADVAIRGTRPAMFVIACTTALFDDPKIRSVGERLLDRPDGPLAYVGATRVCHPAWNSIVGRQIALELQMPGRRLGDLMNTAVTASLGPPGDDDREVTKNRRLIEFVVRSMLPKGTGVDLERLKDEGASMYVLLGDPAIALPFPKDDLAVAATRSAEAIDVTVTGTIPDGAEIAASLEVGRDVMLPFQRDPAWSPEETMKRRHDRANDKAIERTTAVAKGGKATLRFAAPADRRDQALFVKARAVYGDDVHESAADLAAQK